MSVTRRLGPGRAAVLFTALLLVLAGPLAPGAHGASTQSQPQATTGPALGSAAQTTGNEALVGFDPSPANIPVGDVIALSVVVNPNGRVVEAAEIAVTYDPAVLQVVDADRPAAPAIQREGPLDIELINRVDHAAGRIDLAAGKFFEPFPNEPFIFARIRFRGLTESGPQGAELAFELTGQLRTYMIQGVTEIPLRTLPGRLFVGTAPSEEAPAAPPAAQANAELLQAARAASAAQAVATAAAQPVSGQEPTMAMCRPSGPPSNPFPYTLVSVPTTTVQRELLETGSVFPTGGQCPSSAQRPAPGPAGPATTSGEQTDNTGAIVLILVLLAGVGAVVWWARRSGPRPPQDAGPR